MILASRRYIIQHVIYIKNSSKDFAFSLESVNHSCSVVVSAYICLGGRLNRIDKKLHVHHASSLLHGSETSTSRSTRMPPTSCNWKWSFPFSPSPSDDHPRSLGFGVETWTLYSGTDGDELAVTGPGRVDELYLEGHRRTLRLLVDPES